jgi:hypothetical protein
MMNGRNAHRILLRKHFINFLLCRHRGFEDNIMKNISEWGSGRELSLMQKINTGGVENEGFTTNEFG